MALPKIASKREQRQARLPLPSVSDLSNVSKLCNKPDEGATGTFWEHLDALRDCLLKAVAVTVVCALVAFFFKDSLFRVVLAPKEAGFVTYRLMGGIGRALGAEGMIPGDFSVKLINTGLANQFVVHVRTALYAGVFCASPYLLYLSFRFVSPA